MNIELNKNQIFDSPIELEVSSDGENWTIEKIDEIDHTNSSPFINNNYDSVFTYARIPQSKTIDTTKAQVFDPPVKMLVSDDPDFPEDLTCEAEVFCIYPSFEFPILTYYNNGDDTPFKYAKPIEKQEDEFEKAWNELYSKVCRKVVKEVLERLKK